MPTFVFLEVGEESWYTIQSLGKGGEPHGEERHQDRGAEPQGIPRLLCGGKIRGGHRAVRYGGQVHPRRHAEPEGQLVQYQGRRDLRSQHAHLAL